MTEKEAIEKLQAKLTCIKLDNLLCVENGCFHNCDDCKYNYIQGTIGEQKEVLEMAIKALEEIHQYREIGTVEECRELKARGTVKKVERINGLSPLCPECGAPVLKNYDYCKRCGQALDWSETE